MPHVLNFENRTRAILFPEHSANTNSSLSINFTKKQIFFQNSEQDPLTMKIKIQIIVLAQRKNQSWFEHKSVYLPA